PGHGGERLAQARLQPAQPQQAARIVALDEEQQVAAQVDQVALELLHEAAVRGDAVIGGEGLLAALDADIRRHRDDDEQTERGGKADRDAAADLQAGEPAGQERHAAARRLRRGGRDHVGCGNSHGEGSCSLLLVKVCFARIERPRLRRLQPLRQGGAAGGPPDNRKLMPPVFFPTSPPGVCRGWLFWLSLSLVSRFPVLRVFISHGNHRDLSASPWWLALAASVKKDT